MLPYASNIGAPKIELNDISKWKEERSGALNNYFNEKYDELKESYLSLMKEYESNKLIYNAKLDFIFLQISLSQLFLQASKPEPV